jgi:uncharacterized protein YjbJ (UPF0337 family)
MSNDNDRVSGIADQVKGKAKETAGDVTGDSQQQGEGKVDQVKGNAKEGMADAKDKVGDMMDNDDKK